MKKAVYMIETYLTLATRHDGHFLYFVITDACIQQVSVYFPHRMVDTGLHFCRGMIQYNLATGLASQELV